MTALRRLGYHYQGDFHPVYIHAFRAFIRRANCSNIRWFAQPTKSQRSRSFLNPPLDVGGSGLSCAVEKKQMTFLNFHLGVHDLPMDVALTH